MSEEQANSSSIKATIVATDTNVDGNPIEEIKSENKTNNDYEVVEILSDENIVASKQKDKPQSQSIDGSKATKKKTDTCSDERSNATHPKDANSKQQNNKKHGPSATMLNTIREAQAARKEMERIQEMQEKLRLEQEEQNRLKKERFYLEQENHEKVKNSTSGIGQQRRKNRHLIRKERDNYQRAQFEIQTASIKTLSHDISPSTSSTNDGLTGERMPINNSSTSFIEITLESEENSLSEKDQDTYDEWEVVDKELIHISDENGIESKISLSETKKIDHKGDKENDQLFSPIERVRRRLERHHELCESHRSTEVLRAPVICVLGHVDAGKTTILDNLRRTNVQHNEAGGITQQIGATNVPLETLDRRTKMCRNIISRNGDLIVPGLLIIDTPGHETFKNLRLRGSSLCDLAILVVDIMHGLAPQTIESIQLLIERQTPFIIALNKVDLLYGWKSDSKKSIDVLLQEQSPMTQNHFEKRCNDIICQFALQHLNVALYDKNPDPNEYYSMVPTSARSGDGMGSLIALIIEKSQTILAKRISFTEELQASVMEVKVVENLGTTVDIALVNGSLSVDDKIIIAGQEGPIVTQIQRLLIPESNQEIRVTNQYQSHRTVKGASSIKIIAKDLEKAMAGLPLFVVRQTDEIDYFKNEIETMLNSILSTIELKEKGVYVQASTLGSLEALLQLLKSYNIRYSAVNIGPVHRKDVMKASVQLEKDPLMATIMAFDVKIERDAQEYANKNGVKILQHDEIYRLCDMFIAYKENKLKEDQEKHKNLAVFPCKLRILPQYIFNARNPIVCGVLVEHGFLKIGTPICVPSKDCIELGRVTSIQKNHQPLTIAQTGQEVCIKIESTSNDTPKAYGRHFDKDDILMSKISRESIDALKAYFRDQMQLKDWILVKELKKVFDII